ncbi:MAG: thymidine phosphorylase, partial [Nanoarchaeota archaeon]
MKLKVKDMDIATGGAHVVILHHDDARLFDLHHMDRVMVKKGKKFCVAVLDIAESARAVPRGCIGLLEEVIDELDVKNGEVVDFSLAKKPNSVNLIKKKLEGEELNYDETLEIVRDITQDKLTSIELTSYVVANYAKGMSQKEIVDLTNAMVATGNKLDFKGEMIVDLHSIGGVPGNRITMIVTPIIIAAGLKMPKTSSRAITSPAGTADTMEVFCPVSASIEKLKEMVDKVGGFILWGGAVNLAPADDKIIKVEHPLNIDAEGQMLASIMAKKASVGITHLLMEIPMGAGAKVKTEKDAIHLRNHFEHLGVELGINLCVMMTNGSEPVGNGIGPVLEAIDVLKVLKNENGPKDLREKSISFAGALLEHCGKTKKGEGCAFATGLLDNGSAYKKFVEMIIAQGGKTPDLKKLKLAKIKKDVIAKKSGKIISIDNFPISKIA